MTRAARQVAAVIAVVGLAGAAGHAIALPDDKGQSHKAQVNDSRWNGRKQHKDYSGKALLGDNIKKNGAHAIQDHGRYSASVNVSEGKITGMKVKHADRGSVPVTKYKTTTNMAQGKMSGAHLFTRSQNTGTMWSGYGYIDDWGDEYFYWFPYAMIDDGDARAIEYYPAD